VGRMQRNKGAQFERQVAHDLKEFVPFLADQIHRSSQADLAYGSDVTGAPRLWVECEHAAKPTWEAKLKQAELDVRLRDSKDKPIAVIKQNSCEPVVLLRLGTLLFFLTIDPSRDVGSRSPLLQVVLRLDWYNFLEVYRKWCNAAFHETRLKWLEKTAATKNSSS